MSNVVEFLEALGRNPEVVGDEAFVNAIAAAPLTGDVKQALRSRNPTRVNAVLGHSCTILSLLVPAEEEKPADDEESETPDRESEARAA